MATRRENRKAKLGTRARRTAAMGTWKCPGPVHSSVPVETTPLLTLARLKYLCVYLSWSQDSVTGIGTRIPAGQFGVGIPAEAIFCPSKMSTQALRNIQPPIQWVPVSFCAGKAARV
jgi:hypothetical protein